MRICPRCRRRPWPYLVALFIGGFGAYLTWLTLGSTDLTAAARTAWTSSIFLLISGLLSIYTLSCMRWYCRHHDHGEH
ncbi:MAG: hypothetical protein KDH88_05540 [Chromatiales bacterium]|nr:hypothetical protein [Chromatiales bacterium]